MTLVRCPSFETAVTMKLCAPGMLVSIGIPAAIVPAHDDKPGPNGPSVQLKPALTACPWV